MATVTGSKRHLDITSDTLTTSSNVDVGAKLFITTTDSNTSSTTALVLNSTEVEARTLGSNAFNSTAFLTSETFSSSDVVVSLSGTDVTAGESITLAGGLSYSGTTLTSANDNTTYSAGTLLDLSSTTFNVDLSELTNNTATFAPTQDHFVILDNGVQGKKLGSSIFGSAAYSNTSAFAAAAHNHAGTYALEYENLAQASGANHDMHQWRKVHASYSNDSGNLDYLVIQTEVPQDNYSMGGFTLVYQDDYNSTGEGGEIKIYGYWNPESNSGFNGFRYECSNPYHTPTIEVCRNSSSGNTAFFISGEGGNYAQLIAKDLWFGYSASSATSQWGNGWVISEASDKTGYTNFDTLNRNDFAAITTNGSTPSLTGGVSATEVRTLIGAGTSSSDTTYSAGTGLTLTNTTFSVTANTYATAAQGTTADAALPKGTSTIGTGVHINLKHTTATGYSEMSMSNNSDHKLVFGSIGSTYTNTDWSGSRYIYSTSGELRIKAATNLRLYSGGMSHTGNLAVTFDSSQAATFTGTIAATNFSGSSSGTNTGDQDLSGYLTSLPSHNHDDRYYTESEIINSEQWHNLGSTQGASPSYPYRYYRITNDLTFDNNRAYEIMIDADDNGGYAGIYHVFICQHNNSGNMDRVHFNYISGDRGRMEVTVASDEHVWIRATAKWGSIRIRGLFETEEVTQMPFATQEAALEESQAVASYDFTWNGDNNTLYDYSPLAIGTSATTAMAGNTLSTQDLTDIGNLSGTNTGDQTLPTLSSLGALSTSGGTVSGGITMSSTSTNPKLDMTGHAGADNYNYFLRAANDGGNKAVHFVNGSTRTADGGANAYTIRNDGGTLILGHGSYTTKLAGSVVNTASDVEIVQSDTSDHWALKISTNGSNNSGFWTTSQDVRLLLRDNDGNIRVDLYPDGTSRFYDNVQFDSQVTVLGNLVLSESAPTISFIDTDSEDDFYIHVNSNNFYVLRNTAGSENTVDGGWDTPHPLQLEGDTNKAYVFGSELKSAAYTLSTAYATSTQGATADAALPKAGGTMSGTMKVTGSIIHEHNSNSGYIAFPKGGMYHSTANAHTGAIKVKLPVHGGDDMVKFTIDIYDYSTEESVTILVSGYIYQASGGNEWVNCTAVNLAHQSAKNYTVRFGGDGSYSCVWVGETTSTWNHLQVAVTNFWGGFYTDVDAYDDAWEITVVTAFGDHVDEVRTNNFPAADYNKIINTPTIPSGNAIIDWTADQGSTNIHSGNYTNTTYSAATTSAAGLMSTTDKTKLDGIETGADVTDAVNVSAAGGMLKAGSETSTAMKSFEASLSNQDDWINSPISILERGNVQATESADKYSPNLNFHWGGRASNSLWMNFSGILHYGSYSATGVPALDGTFKTGTLYAGTEDITATKVGNWNTAYGWGNHASAGYGTSNLTIGTTATTAMAGNTSLFDGAYSSLSGIPSTFAPSSHSHNDLYYSESEIRLALARINGWEAGYGSGTASNIKWNLTEEALELKHDSDTSIGAVYKAVYMEAGETKRFSVMIKGSSPSANGMYIRLYQHDGDLPDGKTHVSNDPQGTFVQDDDRGDSGWYENGAVSNSWTNFERDYKAPTSGYVSIVVLNWTGVGVESLFIKTPDIQTRYAKSESGSIGISQLAVSDGTNGQVLTTNGSGTLSFATVSSGSADTNYYLDGVTRVDGTNTLEFSVNGATDQTFAFGANAFNSTTIPAAEAYTAHEDTSTLSGIYGDTANGTKIDTITVDANGHVTAVTTGATGNMTGFFVEDGDGTEVQINNANEWKFVEGTGIDINWTDTSTGSDTDPYDLTITCTIDSPAEVGLANLSSSGNALAGTFTATGDLIAYSDARVKENVETIPNALEKVTALRGVNFNKIGEEKRSTGVIAQEVAEVIPEVVHESEDGMLGVAYGNITGLLIEAIKEQQKQIDELKAKLDGSTK